MLIVTYVWPTGQVDLRKRETMVEALELIGLDTRGDMPLCISIIEAPTPLEPENPQDFNDCVLMGHVCVNPHHVHQGN